MEIILLAVSFFRNIKNIFILKGEECLNICREELTTVDTSNDEKSACDVDIDPGSCGGIFMRYGFDRRTAQCRQFQYG